MSVRGEERSRKRCAVRDDESAFTSEQQRRGVTFFGEEEQDKRADVTRYHAGRSLAIFATTSADLIRTRFLFFYRSSASCCGRLSLSTAFPV